MSAPDRIWTIDSGWSGGWTKEPYSPGTEYIRRDAFPVEEIQEYLKFPYSNAWDATVPEDLFRRILELLGENDE